MDNAMKVALVTGGAVGLGRQISMALLRQGCRVGVNFLKSEKEAEELASRFGSRVLLLRADVGDAGQAQAIVDELGGRWGRLDLLVNNAGIVQDSLLIRQTEEQWDRVVRTNLTGPFHMIRAAAPLMISSGGGHIINISSYAGLKGKAGQAAYSTAKAALLGLTMAAAHELAEHRIRVNAVLPGYMATAMGAAAAKAAREAAEENLVGSLAEPSAVAESIVRIARTGFITGQTLCLDSRIY